MKVDNPRFTSQGGLEDCKECPWADEDGMTLCLGGLDDGCSGECPTAANYAYECDKACRLAEQANKGE